MKQLDLETPLRDLDLSLKSRNMLWRRDEIRTVEDVLDCNFTDLAFKLHIGSQCLLEIMVILKRYDLFIKDYTASALEILLSYGKVPVIADVEILKDIKNKYFVKNTKSLELIKTGFERFYDFSIKEFVYEKAKGFTSINQLTNELLEEGEKLAADLRARYNEIMSQKVALATSEQETKPNKLIKFEEEPVSVNSEISKYEKKMKDLLDNDQKRYKYRLKDDLQL